MLPPFVLSGRRNLAYASMIHAWVFPRFCLHRVRAKTKQIGCSTPRQN
jgi:hypothetical protein